MSYRTVKGSFQNKLKNLIYKAGRKQVREKDNPKEFVQGFNIGYLYGLMEARDLHYRIQKRKYKRKGKVRKKKGREGRGE